MIIKKLEAEISATTYPGRGILFGKTPDGKNTVIAYFIMGRSANSRNRVFTEKGRESVRKLLILPNCRIPVSSSMHP